MAQTFDSFKIDHVYREKNAEADALANQALDETSGNPSPTQNTSGANRQAQPQPRKIRARFRNGTLVPIDPLDLPEGSEVELSLRPIRDS